MKNLKYILLLVVIFLISCEDKDKIENAVQRLGDKLPRKEMRAVWLTTAFGNDWPMTQYDVVKQKQQYIDYLDMFKAHNMNTVIVQIRPMADAFYPSTLEPWSSVITGVSGKDPGYDVLKFMIEEAHNRGLEFHAWMNPYRIATRLNATGTFNVNAEHIAVKTHPEWALKYNKIMIYNPALPEVQDHLLKVVDEVITKYDVDGIHFDDYFYPELDDKEAIVDTAEYRIYGQGYKTVEDFRRGNVNKVIQSVSNLISTKKPGMLFSVSPAQDNNKNYNTLYADVTLWCQNGWLDIVIPQLYTSTGAATSFKERVHWWPQFSYKTPILIGYALYKFGDTTQDRFFQTTEELELQFARAALEPKVKGSVLYTAKNFLDNRINIIGTLDKIYADQAVIPFMGRKTVADPSPASSVSLSGDVLKWNAESGLRSVVYKIKDAQGNDNLKVVTITTDKTCKLLEKGDYVVATLNRDNTESEISAVVSYK